MVNEHTRCLTLLDRDIQIKIRKRDYYTPIKMAKMKE